MEFTNNPQIKNYIQNARPNTDCIFCEIHHYYQEDGTPSEKKYAKCKCPKICKGLCSVDISAKPDYTETNCKKCKHYSSKQQLTIFKI